MKSIDSELKQLQVNLLQLQRSALIDTQAIMQILIDCEICTSEDIVNTRQRIEDNSPEVKRIDEEILASGGQVTKTPKTEKQKNVQEQMDILKDLLKQLTDETGGMLE